MIEDQGTARVPGAAPTEAARHRATFFDAALGIAHADFAGLVLDANPALCAMLGYTRRDLVGRRLSDLQAAADAHGLSGSRAESAHAARHASESRPAIAIERYAHSSGAVLWVQRTSSVVTDANGAQYCLHFFEDITARRQNEQEQRVSDLRYRRTLESALDCIVSTDHVGRIIEFNPMAEKVFGYRRAEVLGKKLQHVLVPPALRKRHAGSMARLVAGAQKSMLNRRIETVALRADGSTIPVELMMQRISDTDPVVFTGFLRDISERKEAEARILRLNRLYRTLSHTSALIVRARDADELFREICRIARQHGGFSASWVGLVDGDTVSLHAHAETGRLEVAPIVLDPDSDDPVAIAVRESRVVVRDEARDASRPAGARLRERGAIAVLPLITDGKVIGVLTLKSRTRGYFTEDIQQLLREMVDELTYALERLQLERRHSEVQTRLAHVSHYDQLTGLPNRGLMQERLTQAIAQAARNGWTLGTLFIDLDRFKRVNDTQGHGVGDALLRQVAARMLECVRGEDSVGRLPGDEFVVVLAHLTDADAAAVVAGKLLRRLREPCSLEGLQVVVSASIGIALYPADGASAEVLMRNADVAMFSAKAHGRDNFQFYTAEMNARAVAKLELESRLREALAHDELRLHYQPKVDLATRRICGFEALLRWQPHGRPLVSPAEFIPLLEETGLITPVGEWVVRTACDQLVQWRSDGLRPAPIAINLSARQLRERGFCEALAAALRERELEPSLIEVEITESSLMDNPDNALSILNDLKAVGVTLAIDDFGTGYSSLAYLQRFPFDTLKIDRSFVRHITSETGDLMIARTIIALAASLGLKSVAEGIETEAQCALLAVERCEQAQGYLFARALPAEAASALLARDEPLGGAPRQTARG